MENKSKQQLEQKNIKVSNEAHHKLKMYSAKSEEQMVEFASRAILKLIKEENGKKSSPIKKT